MATLKNHKITGTLKAAVDYITNDKTETNTGIPEDIERSIAYATNDKTGTVTYKTMSSYMNCRPDDPLKDFYYLINSYGADELKNGNAQTKDGKPVIAWHYIQSFDGVVDPVTAHELGRRFAEEMFPGHPVAIGTHTNTGHTHNHFIICAWDWDGKKWHQCNDIYQKAREVSDRLCEEYGLNVLDATRKQKLIRWTDSEGREHLYEPTDRKNALLDQRRAGMLSGDRVGSYRDTDAYADRTRAQLSEKEIIKRDIENLLPVAQSYEHMLKMLRGQGYKINDKRKDGGWLKHVSFTPPTASRAMRDSSLSGDGYYERENLEKIIGEYVLAKEGRGPAPIGNYEEDIPYFEDYIYGETDIDSINEDWRKDREPDGSYTVNRRGEPEREVIQGVKADNRTINTMTDTGQYRMTRTDYYVKRIQESFDSLRFMEKEGLLTQAQINRAAVAGWNQHNDGLAKIEQIGRSIENLEKILEVPKQAQTVRDRIDALKDNEAYREFDMEQDKATLARYEAIMEKYDLGTEGGVRELKGKIEDARDRTQDLERTLKKQRERLDSLDLCARVLYRTDKDFGREQSEDMNEYWKISRAGQRVEEERQNKTEKKGGGSKDRDGR